MLELRVALSRMAQPVWFRVLKWTIAIGVGTYLWRGPYFWGWLGGALGLGVTVHLVWRSKTKVWTQAWGGWNDHGAEGTWRKWPPRDTRRRSGGWSD
jgi:hypothetical protein